MLFVIIDFLLVFRLDLDIAPPERFRPHPPNLLIKFLVHLVSFLEIIYPVHTTGNFSAISEKCLPLLRKFSRPKPLPTTRRTALIQRKNCRNISNSVSALKKSWSRIDRSDSGIILTRDTS
jgi:hypothetical protein